MSRETLEWLNRNVLVGFADKRGNAWHYKASEQGEESNHYDGAIPVEDVRRRLFYWQPVVAPLSATFETAEGVQTVTDESRKVIVRPDTGSVLGVFRESYQAHDYTEWLVDSVAALLHGDLQIGSAGLLDGGAKAWVSVEVPDNLVTPEGVEFRPHILAATSLDGSLATTFKRVVTRVVCDNTADAALGEKGQQIKIKHSRYSSLKLGEARDALNIVYSIADEFQEQVRILCQTKVEERQWRKFIELSVPLDDKQGASLTNAHRKRDTYERLYKLDPRVAPWTGTAFGVLQCANTFLLHENKVVGRERVERNQVNLLTGITERADAEARALLERALA